MALTVTAMYCGRFGGRDGEEVLKAGDLAGCSSKEGKKKDRRSRSKSRGRGREGGFLYL
jgi:hypothetical protein